MDQFLDYQTQSLSQDEVASFSAGRNFSKYAFHILKNVWTLEKQYYSLLDSNKTYLTTLSKFLSQTEEETYPNTYEDTFLDGKKKFFISYIFTSGAYLDDLCEQFPETPIAYQLRVSRQHRFYYCLVRTWDRKWTKDWLIATGAREV